MNEREVKEFMCEVGRRLYNKGFAAANDGNISVRLGPNEFFCTPTMVSKGFMKPEDICRVDGDGKQLEGVRKRTSEFLLHLAVYKHRPDVNGVVHCHPPYATAFAVAREPIPKCILPEVEVFLGEVAMAPYETPGGQKFANTIVPYVKDCNTILLANHGTITFGPTLENAYFNSEIIDAYCKILLLAKQLGRVNYLSEDKTRELLEFKQRIGYDDPRLHCSDCDLCGNSIFSRGYGDFVPEPLAFRRPEGCHECHDQSTTCEPCAAKNGRSSSDPDFDRLVKAVTDQVMAALALNA